MGSDIFFYDLLKNYKYMKYKISWAFVHVS